MTEVTCPKCKHELADDLISGYQCRKCFHTWEKFNIGDVVKEKRGIEGSLCKSNGRITKINKTIGKYYFRVEFPNGKLGDYKEDELVKVSSEPKKKLLYADYWKVGGGY